MDTPGLRLRARISTVDHGHRRLQVWVDEAQDMSPAIFVFQRYPTVPGENAPDDRFTNVASVADMLEYPESVPGKYSPFFRESSFDLVFKSVALMLSSWDLILSDVRLLVRNLGRFESSSSSSSMSSLSSHSSSSSSSSDSSAILNITSSSSSSSSSSLSSSSSRGLTSPSSSSSSQSLSPFQIMYGGVVVVYEGENVIDG